MRSADRQNPTGSQIQIVSKQQRAQLISRYVAEWIAKIEASTNREISSPQPGQLTVRAVVKKDGNLTVLEVLNNTTTNYQEQRIVEIIHSLSPFPAFPPPLAQSAQQLIIHCDISFPSAGGILQNAQARKRIMESKEERDGGALSENLGRAFSSPSF
jgi:outer membrane biosynthesis protein TonB